MHADEDPLEQDVPLDDGTAETVARISCPYCGAPNVVFLDPGSGIRQEYVEDCQVCCQPCILRVTYDSSGGAHVEASTEDDG